MKKFFVMMMLVAGVAVLPAASHADTCAPDAGVGRACATDDGGVVLDGNAANPDPLDGYIWIHGDGSYCANDEGNYDDDPFPGCAVQG